MYETLRRRTDALERAAREDPEGIALVAASAATLLGLLASVQFVPDLALPVLVVFGALTAVGWTYRQAQTAYFLTLVAALLTVATVAFITRYLFASAEPAVAAHGIDLLRVPIQDGEVRWFFWLEQVLPAGEAFWNPRAGDYSLLPAIWATVVVTTIAATVACPLGLLGALFVSDVASEPVREVVKPGVEVLAGIPSIVYGFVGFQLLNGFVQDAFLDDGASFLIAGLVVGLMALPTVVSVSEDALSSVPGSAKAGSRALGATRWQTMKSISIPTAISGISAGMILGLGRAVGETMAVAAILAAGVGLADPLYDPFDAGATLTSLIAHNYGSASASTEDVLFVAGVLLFGIVATMSVAAQLVERRMRRKLEGRR